MADKFLNETSVATIRDWANGKFALDSDLDAVETRTGDLEDAVQELIVEGGEPNVIEVVKVDGTALQPDSNKAVNIPPATTSTPGLMSAADKTKLEGVESGAEENTIETIKKNGTAISPDANKAVDIPIPTVAKSGSGENEKATITDGQNTYDVPTVDAMEAYVGEHGGVIQKIKQNGTEMTIDSSDKSVNFTNATTSADGLMSSADKTKLNGIEAGAQENVQSDWNQSSSSADDFIKNKPTKLSDFTNDGDGTSGSTFPTTEQMNDAIDAKVTGALQPKGSTTFANLPALTAANVNTFYNVSDAFTTTADFIEGAGLSYPAGTNVAIINTGTDQNPVYKYDAMVGTTDLSAYWTSTTGVNNSLNAMTVAEINAILNPATP